MKIVEIKKEDKEEVYNLAKKYNSILNSFIKEKVYRPSFNKELFEHLFASCFGPKKRFIGIKENNKIVAFLAGDIRDVENGTIGYIDNMFVIKDCIGKGYSTLLKNDFFNWLKANKIKFCQLHVLSENPAKEVYDHWDFKVDGYRMTKKI